MNIFLRQMKLWNDFLNDFLWFGGRQCDLPITYVNRKDLFFSLNFFFWANKERMMKHDGIL